MFGTKNIILIALSTLVLCACGGSNDQDAGELEGSLIDQIPFHENASLDSCLVIGHKVTDYDTWKAAYDIAEPVREKHGIYTQMVMQGYSDTNLAMVFTKVSGISNAKEYVTSENLKKSMKVAGVEGEMSLYWLKHHMEADSTSSRKCIVYMSFKVSKFEEWKKAFMDDYVDEPVKDFDVLHVFQSVQNKNEVSMIFSADSPEFVKAMESNTMFRMKMLAAGVISYPKTYLLRERPI